MSEQENKPTNPAPAAAAASDVNEQVDQLAAQVEEVVLGPDGNPLSKKALKKLEKEREKEKKKQERLALQAAERAAREANEV
ncbi:hypothetical protein LPJ75_004632, partial [Coemansia sp. RSA 2598]